ncbi:ORF47L [orange spotted grouper iridovirus]|uniref:ORF47L n=1 Tax=orange spotted grouper iridovirus TaxID=2848011 RepID=Q4KSB0_ISKNV|nr:ORF47L [Orange-spotted grouper iridovirus]
MLITALSVTDDVSGHVWDGTEPDSEPQQMLRRPVTPPRPPEPPILSFGASGTCAAYKAYIDDAVQSVVHDVRCGDPTGTLLDQYKQALPKQIEEYSADFERHSRAEANDYCRVLQGIVDNILSLYMNDSADRLRRYCHATEDMAYEALLRRDDISPMDKVMLGMPPSPVGSPVRRRTMYTRMCVQPKSGINPDPSGKHILCTVNRPPGTGPCVLFWNMRCDIHSISKTKVHTNAYISSYTVLCDDTPCGTYPVINAPTQGYHILPPTQDGDQMTVYLQCVMLQKFIKQLDVQFDSQSRVVLLEY